MDNEDGAHVYMLRCSDGSHYVGSARRGLERRLSEHNNGTYEGYTAKRPPVVIVWSEHFLNITDAIAVERQVTRAVAHPSRRGPEFTPRYSRGPLLRMR